MVVPLRGEKVCGDACSARLEGRDLAVLMSDGLGHGPGAAEASLAAVGVFEEQSGLDHAELLERIHGALRGTRGAAVALVRFSPGECTVQFTGVGNISGVLMSAGSARQMISYPGTVGMEMRKVQTMSYPWADSTLAVLHSDGIATHWSLEPYAGLERQDPAVIAAILYRDFARQRDDASVLVVRRRAG